MCEYTFYSIIFLKMLQQIKKSLKSEIETIWSKTSRISCKLSKANKQKTAIALELIISLEKKLSWQDLETIQKTKQLLMESLLIQEKHEYKLWTGLTDIVINDEKNKYDKMTWVLNKDFFNQTIEHLYTNKIWFWLIMFDLNKFKQINDIYWHEIWDDIIKEFAKTISMIFSDNENAAFRVWGDEFKVISAKPQQEVLKLLEKLNKWLKQRSFKFLLNWELKEIYIEYSVWYEPVSIEQIGKLSLREILEIVDKKMYVDKRRVRRETIQ